MVGWEGIEPSTVGLRDRCSGQLSYQPKENAVLEIGANGMEISSQVANPVPEADIAVELGCLCALCTRRTTPVLPPLNDYSCLLLA